MLNLNIQDNDVEEAGSESFILQEKAVDKSQSTICIDLYFDKNVSRLEISNSRTYVMKLFVTKSEIKITRVPYVLETLHNDMSWKNVRLNIFVNDTIILQEKFANIDDWLKGNLIIDYYENSEIELPSRIIDNKSFDNFSRYVKFRFCGIDSVMFEKSYKETFFSLN